MNNKKIYDDLIKILLKKATGFYYTEEQEDYEKTQKKSNISENQCNNLNFFEIIDTVKPETNQSNDTIESSNGKSQKEQNNQNLILVKKKITTHYIPPDMLAVKILFETIKEKVNEDDLEKLSDKELLNLKDKLLGELINEDKQNQSKS